MAPTPVTTVRRRQRDDGNDWTAGYAEGKRAHETAIGDYRTAGDYLKATAAGADRGHAWVDGFKTGWSVARDDRPYSTFSTDRLAG
jgi:hypothetical protein